MAALITGAELPGLLGVDGNVDNSYAERGLTAWADLATNDATTLTAANDSVPPALVGSAWLRCYGCIIRLELCF